MRETGNREQRAGNRESEFERKMTRALRSVDAPGGFAQRVLARAAQEHEISASRPRPDGAPGSMRWRWGVPVRGWMAGAVAAVLALGVFVGGQKYQHHRRERLANEQFEAAARITDRALAHTREQMARAGVVLE